MLVYKNFGFGFSIFSIVKGIRWVINTLHATLIYRSTVRLIGQFDIQYQDILNELLKTQYRKMLACGVPKLQWLCFYIC